MTGVGSTEPARSGGVGSAGAGAGTVESGLLPADGVRRMFDRIAPVYDVMNTVMTAGLDRRWRTATIHATVHPGDAVLDACCGTGDLARAALRAGAARAVGLDFSEAMLERARRKVPAAELVRGDVLALPFGDDEFDAVVVGFGVRNVESLEGALGELRRVLKPGGRLGILEITSEPQNRVVEARVIQPLDSMGPGDPVMLFAPPTEVPDQGKSEEPVTGTIVEFKIPKQETAQGEIVYIDLGAQDGIGAGDRLKVIRPGNRESMKTFLPDYPFAELKVLSVQERTATTKIVRSLDAVHRGDFVTRLLGRPRPLDPGLDRRGSPDEPQ